MAHLSILCHMLHIVMHIFVIPLSVYGQILFLLLKQAVYIEECSGRTRLQQLLSASGASPLSATPSVWL